MHKFNLIISSSFFFKLFLLEIIFLQFFFLLFCKNPQVRIYLLRDHLSLKVYFSDLRVNALTYGKMQNSLHLISEFKRCIRYPSTSSTDTSSNASLNSSTDSVTSVQQPLNWTSSKPLMNMLNLKLARAMLEAGCNMDHTDYQSKETPVFKAIVYNYYDLVKYFVIEGKLLIRFDIRNELNFEIIFNYLFKRNEYVHSESLWQ